MENECAEHICIDMEILMMTKLIMPLQACYPGAPMNSIEKALESERAIISGGHLTLNKIVIRNIFPKFISREFSSTEGMHIVSPFSMSFAESLLRWRSEW